MHAAHSFNCTYYQDQEKEVTESIITLIVETCDLMFVARILMTFDGRTRVCQILKCDEEKSLNVINSVCFPCTQ